MLRNVGVWEHSVKIAKPYLLKFVFLNFYTKELSNKCVDFYKFTPSKSIQCICMVKVNNLFYTDWSLFASGKQVISYIRTVVCYSYFDTYFISVANLYKNQFVFKCTPSNNECWLRKIILMTIYWPSHSVRRWMYIVRNSEIQNMVCFRCTVDMVYNLDFFIRLIVIWLE